MEIDLELYRQDVRVGPENSVRLSVIDVQPERPARTLVFIHGFGGWATQWRKQLRFFSDTNRCIAPDLRGHGLSDKPDSSYSMDELRCVHPFTRLTIRCGPLCAGLGCMTSVQGRAAAWCPRPVYLTVIQPVTAE